MNALVLVLSLFFRLGCRIKNLFYDLHIFKPTRAPLPVISSGSIALGGTEKTPLAMEILRWLLERGYRPALVSRGYKGRWVKKGGVVSDGKRIAASWKQAGDEPFMVARAIPEAGVFVGKNRLASCQRASELGFNVVILDDGFQHRRLHRDIDIAILPPPEVTALREPRSSLQRADIILVNTAIAFPASNLARPFFGIPKNVFSYSVVHEGFFHLFEGKPIRAEDLARKKLLAFCGIARPERFFFQLQATGTRIVSSIVFPDHFTYPDSSLTKIIQKLKATGAQAAVTTEKDALKILDRRDLFGNIPIYCLKIAIKVDQEFYHCLEDFLEKKLKGHIR